MLIRFYQYEKDILYLYFIILFYQIIKICFCNWLYHSHWISYPFYLKKKNSLCSLGGKFYIYISYMIDNFHVNISALLLSRNISFLLLKTKIYFSFYFVKLVTQNVLPVPNRFISLFKQLIPLRWGSNPTWEVVVSC